MSILVTVSKHFTAPPEAVFDAWLDPKLIGQWMFGSRLRDEHILRIEVDARIGGKFSFKVRRDDADIDHVGEYLELSRPHRLVFTWGIAGESDGGSQVIVDISPTEDGCLLSLTHQMDPKWADYRDRVYHGWTTMTEMLETVLREQEP